MPVPFGPSRKVSFPNVGSTGSAPRIGTRSVRDLRERRAPADPEELAEFETDVLAELTLARASALADAALRGDAYGKSIYPLL